MRSKALLLFLICLVGSSIIFITFSYQRPSIQTLVTETHKQIKSFQENLKDVEEKRLVADLKYLTLLGLDEESIADSSVKSSNLTVVSLIRPGDEIRVYGFVKNVSHFLPMYNIVIFGVGMRDEELNHLRMITNCNSTKCSLVEFDLNPFPNHVGEDRLQVFRPLVIQTALNTLGNVLFMDSNIRLNNSDINKYLNPKSGILTWQTKKQPISALTHPKMYEYFHASAESFWFLPLVQTSHLVIRNLKEIKENIMLPWVECALTRDCISPIGAQSAGCRFNKKPRFRYSGCHSYDTSALNIVLALYFNSNYSLYVNNNETSYFTEISLEEINDEYLTYIKQINVTETNARNFITEH